MIMFMMILFMGQASIALEPENVILTQSNGAGLDTLSPSDAGLVIGGSGITEGAGLLGNFIYLSQDQVDDIKANKSVDGYGLGDSWTGPTLYSSYHNHGTPEYVYTLAEGINLKAALTTLGVDVTSAPVALEATATDLYSKIVDDAFGKEASRNYIAPDGTVGDVVDPILIFYDNQVETSDPGVDTIVPTTTAAITDPNALFAYGQKESTESSNCNFVKNTVKIRAGLDAPAFTITQDSTTKTISLSDIALLGIYETSYSWDNSGTQVTQSVKGVPLSALLAKLGIAVPGDKGLVVNVNNGSGTVASSRTIGCNEIGQCFVAFDAFENSQRVAGCSTPLRIYGPGETQERVLIENVVGASVGEVSQGSGGGKEPGGDISNSVFYIAVKDTASGGIQYYYYTKAELEGYETQEDYTYNDHSVIKTVTCKGALLSDLLDGLQGVIITDEMIVQYAEEDGYHADAATAVINSNYKDTVESLTKQTLSGGGSTREPLRPTVTYEIHEEYANPDQYNVNDPAGVFKDADNNSGYLRVYRDTGDANSTVMKYMMGVVISAEGSLLSGNNGCVVISVSDKNPAIKVRNDITIKGLVPGMQYAVKAPLVTNANLAVGQTSPVLITVGGGAPADQAITFSYTEDTYFYVENTITDVTTNYTYTDLIATHEQVPEAGAAPYGYAKPMYYRYNGVWLSDLVSGLSGDVSIKLVAKDGSKMDITEDIALYFAAYNNTQSKTSTNIPEGKRVTVTYDDAKVIIPGTGVNITGAGATDYTPEGRDVDVLMATAEGLEITSQGSGGGKEPGGDISNSVFYIAVKDTASGGIQYYYYTRAELEAYETQEDYTYNDHSVIKTVTCKGALLSDLLDNLQGATITDDMIVQYAEEDGYHADAATAVINSNYKDTVESLTKQTLSGGGSTREPLRPTVTYEIHEEYANPDQYNVNDPAGVFKDADNNSGYLRVYRDTGDANSTVMKYMMGVVISAEGSLLSGNNGCVVISVSDKNPAIKVRNDITIKGLVPGMQYAVKAPLVTNANLAVGQTSPVLITVGGGAPADQAITFSYTEDTYFYVENTITDVTTNYTYTDLIATHEQVPEAGAAPYGYAKPMYYRYNGVWLSDLVSGLSGDVSIKLVAKDGSKMDITEDIALYFAAYNNTQSKTSTNIPEGKRVTVTYDDAKVIIPGTGVNITGAGATDYTPAGRDVDVLMAAAEGLEITSQQNSTGKYTVAPVEDDSVYEVGATTDGINTMTVKTGISGLKYFGTVITPVVEHEGQEAVIFVHLRNGVQLSLNVTKAEFDVVDNAQAGFNVEPGDMVKVYIVDGLTNAVDFNPTLLQ
jgi:hypothetical protein